MTLDEFKKLDLKYGDILQVRVVIEFTEKDRARTEDVIDYYGYFVSLYPCIDRDKNYLTICHQKISWGEASHYQLDLAKVFKIKNYGQDK